eukprot:GHVS01002317.1.p1 GENE.GHVS01002317.1~~GHVS01002317.1.p1  ORF type:complete len:130 (+),score=13.30 GHVS01002317.1:211-600(+)
MELHMLPQSATAATGCSIRGDCLNPVMDYLLSSTGHVVTTYPKLKKRLWFGSIGFGILTLLFAIAGNVFAYGFENEGRGIIAIKCAAVSAAVAAVLTFLDLALHRLPRARRHNNAQDDGVDKPEGDGSG